MSRARPLGVLLVLCAMGQFTPSHAADGPGVKGALALAAKPANPGVAAVPSPRLPVAAQISVTQGSKRTNRLPDGNVEFCSGPGHQ